MEYKPTNLPGNGSVGHGCLGRVHGQISPAGESRERLFPRVPQGQATGLSRHLQLGRGASRLLRIPAIGEQFVEKAYAP